MSYSNAQVARIFANSSDNVNGGNVSTRNGNYYSYRTVIARKAIFEGRHVMFVTSRNYSPTTSRHVSNLLSAARYHEIVFVPDATAGRTISNAAELHHQSVAALKSAQRRRSPELKAQDLANAAEFADLALRLVADDTEVKWADVARAGSVNLGPRQLLTFFRSVATGKGYDLDVIDRAARKAAAAREKRQRERLEHDAAGRAERALKWVAGDESARRPSDKPSGSCYIRANDENVETSGGIAVSLTVARAAFCRWRKGTLAVGEELADVHGYGYAVKKVTPQQLTVGCHTIDREDADAIAIARGWTCE